MLSVQIANLRTQNRLTQAQLAKKLCISASALGMYEQGRRVPSLELLVKMAQYFHVSLDYLITGSEFTPQPDSRTSEKCPCSTCLWKECAK